MSQLQKTDMERSAEALSASVGRALSEFRSKVENKEDPVMSEVLLDYSLTMKSLKRACKDPDIQDLYDLARAPLDVEVERIHVGNLREPDLKAAKLRQEYLSANMPGVYAPEPKSSVVAAGPAGMLIEIKNAVLNFEQEFADQRSSGSFDDIPKSRLLASDTLEPS